MSSQCAVRACATGRANAAYGIEIMGPLFASEGLSVAAAPHEIKYIFSALSVREKSTI
jgi:hypothetical protein